MVKKDDEGENKKELIKPDHPHQCIKCEINFHQKGYKFVINPKHRCWFEQEERIAEQVMFCPECGSELTNDLELGDDYCPNCGLITRSSSEYTGVTRISLPYGLKI